MPDPEPGIVHHVHEHFHRSNEDAREYLTPDHPDPLARYDVLGRKQPKRGFGFIEVARIIPGYAAQFSGRVPDDRWEKTDDNQAVFECVCGDIVYAPFNLPTDCAGCDRTFVYLGLSVRVGRGLQGEDPDDPELAS